MTYPDLASVTPLGRVRWLADQARQAGDERHLIDTLTAMLVSAEGVLDAAVYDLATSEPQPGRHDAGEPGSHAVSHQRFSVFAADTAAYVVALRCDPAYAKSVDEAAVALTATASAVLTAQRAVSAARVDGLTRLLNRTALDAVLETELRAAGAGGRQLHALMLDLDGFKDVNDDIGHLAGDTVLREVGAALAAAVRSYDHVARTGGDEFVVLMPALSAVDVAERADIIRRMITRRATAAAGRDVGCSIGVACWRAEQSGEQLLDTADRALRDAKQRGRGRVATAVEPAAIRSVLVVASGAGEELPELREALAGRGLTTVFQPIKTLQSDSLVGYEALSRGPGRLERPDRLIAHARDAGKLVELDRRLRECAFRTAAGAGLRTPLTLFVNIEPETLVMMTEDNNEWRRDDQPFPSITEVTERALFARPGKLVAACTRLRDLGWGIALDDVGQDPRALALLPILAPDVIKLDLRLLRERPPSELATVVIAISAEAERTGAKILAEGVESDEHAERGAALGATLVQGWHVGRPGSLVLDPSRMTAAATVPRSQRAAASRGITPFMLIASRGQLREADTELLRELQADFERRALGLGTVATLATALPDISLDRSAPRRLRHLAQDIGFAVLLTNVRDDDSRPGYLTAALDDDHPFADEWVTTVACPHYALTMVARRTHKHSNRWTYAISHDVITGLQATHMLFLALESAGHRP